MTIEQIHQKLSQMEEKWRLTEKERDSLFHLFEQHIYRYANILNDIVIENDYLYCKLNYDFNFILDVYHLEEDIDFINNNLENIMDNGTLRLCSMILKEKLLNHWDEEEMDFIYTLYWISEDVKNKLADVITKIKPCITEYKYDQSDLLTLVLDGSLHIIISFDLHLEEDILLKQIEDCEILATCMKNYLITTKLIH